jgi:hypothetical protein
MRERRPIEPKALEDMLKEHALIQGQTNRSWILKCPICSKDKLYMLKETGLFVCWVCKDSDNFSGDPEFALTKLTSLPIKEIQGILYGETVKVPDTKYMNLDLKDLYDYVEEEPELPVLPTIGWPEDYFGIDLPESMPGLQYLLTREVPLWMATEYGLRYSPSKRRVAFPVRRDGRLVGYQARIIVPHEWVDKATGVKMAVPKILTSKDLDREHCLMFEHRLEGLTHCVLSEGPVDAIKAHLCGGNVATMGKSVSRGQLELLRRRGITRFYLAMDPDAAASTAKLVEELADTETYQVLPPPHREDLGASTFEEVLDCFRAARRVRSWDLFLHLD